MSSSYGENLRLTIFGQSHSPAIGVTVEGIPAGQRIDLAELQRLLNRRAPGPLRLWCGKLALNPDCPLADYRGQTFAAPPPEWWELK